ncbi:MAG: DUF885 domain-containing protein [Bryobacterales bacterium]|nr:DUF885 domain-containing protein [Bryobacterales bacterium]
MRIYKPILSLIVVAFLAFHIGCQRNASDRSPNNSFAPLHALFEKEWEFRLRENPLFATSVGRMEWNDRLPDFGLAAAKRSYGFYKALLGELDTIPAESLSNPDRISYDVFRLELERNVDSYEAGGYLMPVNSDSGFHIYFARLAEEVPLRTTKDYENLIARLRAWPDAVDGMVELLGEGLKRGFTPPSITMQGYERTIAAHIVDRPEESVFHGAFMGFPTGVPAADRERLRFEGERAIMEAVLPGYRRLHEFFVKQYLPGCRKTLAAYDLPNGRDFYARELRYFTTLPATPEEIHETGLREVARIRKEMEGVIRGTGFRGSFAGFLRFLRTDRRFYAKTPEELLQRAAWIAKRMDGQLPAFFGRLPRQPYTVEAVPAAIAPKYTGGRYVPAPYGGTKPGIYWVNTYALETRPLYTQEALTLHEAVPGHHLQIALAAELEGLPAFRRFVYSSAFGEGWGLYSELLGKEAGFYQDPYSEFGRLTYEMWRACRLVVDTGVHARGWTRQQVIDYLAENTALPIHECTTETDRYISWPGQALAYKMGEIAIRDLRAKAEKELGQDFDIRAFHDALLENGSVPLTTLGRVVDAHIAERLRGRDSRIRP